jgi:hypothetical protein
VNDISNAEMAVQLTSIQSQLYLLLYLTRNIRFMCSDFYRDTKCCISSTERRRKTLSSFLVYHNNSRTTRYAQ